MIRPTKKLFFVMKGNWTNPIFIALFFNASILFSQADFLIPDTVCVNDVVQPINTTSDGNYYSWNFCNPDVNNPATAVDLGNAGGMMDNNVMSDMVWDSINNNYFINNILRVSIKLPAVMR